MPLFEVLYYPYFEPTEIWLRRYLMVYDKVWSVVPKDAKFNPSRGIEEIAGRIPNSFETIFPTEKDKSPDNIDIDRLEKAFKLISSDRKSIDNANEVVLQIDKLNGNIGIEGHTLLHHDKITNKIFEHLEKYGLINRNAKDIVTAVSSNIDDYIVVDIAAADLIMSTLADRIAQRRSFFTITDQEIPFIVSSLSSLPQHSSTATVRSMLTSAVLNFEIPEDIALLSYQEFIEVRNSYSDIRETFHSVIMDLNKLYQLDYIKDPDVLNEKVEQVTRNFNAEVIKYKKSIIGRKVKKWLPLSIGALSTIGGVITGIPAISYTSAGLSVIVTVMQEVLTEKGGETEKNKLKRMVTGMQKDIIKQTKVRRLI